MNNNFKKLLAEASFTNEILVNGITQLEYVNYSRKGLYFSAFTSISTGLERIGKLCLIIDYYIQNNGSFPNEEFLKNQIGHDLVKLYKKSQLIIDERKINLRNLEELNDPIHKNILEILSKFSKGDRYSNINFLVKSKFINDPIAEWYTKVETAIFDKHIPSAQKDKMKKQSIEYGELLQGTASARFISETGNEINSIEKSSYLIFVSESIKRHRQLQVLQISRYFIEILCELEYNARNIRKEIPFFKEVFEDLRNNDDFYLKNEKFFDTL